MTSLARDQSKIGIILLAGCSVAILTSCGRYLPENIPVFGGALTHTPFTEQTPVSNHGPIATPPPTPTPSIPENWTEVIPGMELRVMQMDIAEIPEPANAILVRIAPEQFIFRVHYEPSSAATVQGWQERINGVFVVNGGFFEDNYSTAGLLVVDEEVFGVSFDRYDDPFEHAGMFGVAGDDISIRLLAEAPYQPDEGLNQAVQGLPMLIDDGRPVDFNLSTDSARRTVIALDRAGRVIFVIVDSPPVSLADLRDWLAEADELTIVAALNLDGGPSTGVVVAAGNWLVQRDSPSRVPIVIEAVPVE